MPAPPITGLPIEAVLPALREALASCASAVLEAPPGAGKTTLVPLHLLAEPWLAGRRILMLEPRRLAHARSGVPHGRAAGRVGGRHSRLRDALRASDRAPSTRIEVVTEGLLTRYLQRDPALEAYGLRDLRRVPRALARRRSRPRLVPGGPGRPAPGSAPALVMSATLDGAAMARHLLGSAPVVRSEGRLFPVRVEHLGGDPAEPLELRVARAVELALGAASGSVLVFLPGAREIRRTAAVLAGATAPAGRSGPCRSMATCRAAARTRRSPAPGGGARSCWPPTSPRPA